MNLHSNPVSIDDDFNDMLASLLGLIEPTIPADDVTEAETAQFQTLLAELNTAPDMSTVFTVTGKAIALHNSDRSHESFHYHALAHSLIEAAPMIAVVRFGYDVYHEAVEQLPDDFGNQ